MTQLRCDRDLNVVPNLTYSSIIISLCRSDYPELTLLNIFLCVFCRVPQSPVKVIPFIQNDDNKTEIGDFLMQKKR